MLEQHVQTLRAFLQNLPLPLAVSCEDLCQAIESKRSVFPVFYMTEYVMRYTALVLKSAYLYSNVEYNEPINNLIRRHLYRPCMKDWKTFIIKTWPIFQKQPDAYLVPNLDRLVLLIEDPKTNKIIHSRNDWSHSSTDPAPSTIIDVFEKTIPHIIDLLDACGIFKEHNLYVYSENDGKSSWKRMMGLEETCVVDLTLIARLESFKSPAVLIFPKEKHLPLYPLIVGMYKTLTTKDKIPKSRFLMFDGLEYNKGVRYVGQFGRGHGKLWLQEYTQLLENKRLPVVHSIQADLHQEELLNRLQQDLEIQKDQASLYPAMYKEIVPFLDVTVQGHLEQFLDSNAQNLFLSGASGTGKSTNVLIFAQKMMEKGYPTIVIAMQDLKTNSYDALDKILLQNLQGRLSVIVSGFNELCKAMGSITNKTVIIIFDGLDEVGSYEGIRKYLQLIEKLQRSFSSEKLKIIMTIRGVHFDKLWNEPNKNENNLIQSLFSNSCYKPTSFRKESGEKVNFAVPLKLLSKDFTKKCFEAYQRMPDYGVGVEFETLSPIIKHACRNPRWLMSFLRTFDKTQVTGTESAVQLWSKILEKRVYPSSGSTITSPFFQDLQGYCDYFLEKQLVDKSTQIFRRNFDPPLSGQSKEDIEIFLMSEGFITITIPKDSRRPLLSAFMEIPDPSLAAAFHRYSERIFCCQPNQLPDFLKEFEGTSLYSVLEQTVLEEALESVKNNPSDVSWLIRLPVELLSILLIRIVEVISDYNLVDILVQMESSKRNEVIESLWVVAQERDAIKLLFNFALQAKDLPNLNSACVYILGRIMRHNEKIEEASKWLKQLLLDKASPFRSEVALNLGNIYRDKGQWRDAVVVYTNALEEADISQDFEAICLASRGEAFIWMQKEEDALADLEKAVQKITSKIAPERRCLIFQKNGIAWRLANRPIKALKAFEKAQNIAIEYSLLTEKTKTQLEIALVFDTLGGFKESVDLIQNALGDFKRQGYIRGIKKSYYCLGRVYERAGKIGDAQYYYEQSLQANKDYFDLFGLQLNHHALARVYRVTDPVKSEKHKKKSFEFGQRITDKSIKGIIFDLDYVLYKAKPKSSSLLKASLKNKILEKVNGRLSEKELTSFVQTALKEGAFPSKNVLDETLDYNQIIDEAYQKIDLDDYLEEVSNLRGILDKCVQKNIPMVIISHGSRSWIDRVLKYLDLEGRFSHIFSKEDMMVFGWKNTNSEIFEQALKVLKLSSYEVVILDDRVEMLEIPYHMGMYTVQISGNQSLNSVHFHYQDAALCLQTILKLV